MFEIIHYRYAANAVLCADVSYMDPKRFPEIREKGLPNTAMKELSKCLLKFDDRATVEALQAELTSLAQHGERLKESLQEEYNTRAATTSDDSGEDLDESVEFVSTSCSACKNCLICCYLLLLTDAYHIIGLDYKFILTLSISQVACERTFSTLKLVKNRPRTSLNQENLEAFILINRETKKEIVMALDKDDIIDKMAESSELLRYLLVY